ncbi:hypothetical protein NA57DRAFT_78175 [Rhizodiscina lignyota]|uniref:Heterokaryon incompatibility domain-containing protein n=1 Tax=Rhizodiscina lignyota TaxID=1504668 RepID=A0A9P4IC57_9PEZI|nr:hypothetical protein NA57DRAFT_78175 [Rhizodiscina lignyota]
MFIRSNGGCRPPEGDLIDPKRCTQALFSPVLNGSPDLVELLVNFGARIEAHNRKGMTALHEAVRTHKANIVRILIDNGADINGTVSTGGYGHEYLSGFTALHLAVLEGQGDIVRILLDAGVDVHISTSYNWTAFDLALVERQTIIANILEEYAGDLKQELNYRAHCFSKTFQNPEQDEDVKLSRFVLDHGFQYWDGKYRTFYVRLILEIQGNRSDVERNSNKSSPVAKAIAKTEPYDRQSSGSERSIAIAAAWLETCTTSHKTCGLNAMSELPSRVIDVGSEGSHPFLCISAQDKARYTALSYCWGTKHNFVTTSSTLDDMMSGVPLHRFPKTMRDAIIITRGLGIRYLWIDALCIIQDSEEDFAKEAAEMGDIYSHATVTIAATDSKSCQDGIFEERNWRTGALLHLDLRIPSGSGTISPHEGTSSIKRILARRDMPWSHESHQILDTRGWTMQEKLLSRRYLSCSTLELHWSCLEATSSETRAYLLPRSFDTDRYLHSDEMQNIQNIQNMLAIQCNERDDGDAFSVWLGLVAEYSKRTFSESTDKIIALAGFQDQLSVLFNDVPIAGMWKNRFFLRSLLWTPCPYSNLFDSGNTADDSDVMGNRFHGPSWSWTSADGEITYENFSSAEFSFLMEVLSWDLKISPGQRSIEGSITIRGKIVFSKAADQFWWGMDDDEVDPLMQYCSHYYREKCRFLKEPGKKWCLLLAERPFEPPSKVGRPRWPNGRKPAMVCMVLEPVNLQQLEFRRACIVELAKPKRMLRRSFTKVIKLL